MAAVLRFPSELFFFPAPFMHAVAGSQAKEILSHIIVPHLRSPRQKWMAHFLLSMLDVMLPGNQHVE